MTAGIANPEFVAKRQEGWSTDPKIIKDQVAEITGVQVHDLQRIQKGGWNEVYKAGDFIVRIPHLTPNILDHENIAKTKASTANVPVPKTLGIATIDVNGTPTKLEVSEFIEGVEMSDLFETASEEEKHRLTVEAGRVLSRIHDVRLLRYGAFGTDGGYERLSESRHKTADQESPMWIQGLEAGGFTNNQATKIIEEFKSLCVKYDEADPALVHHDLSPRHLIVKEDEKKNDEKKIAAVLDWGNSRSGSPFDDIANSTPGAFNQEWLLEGYENLGIKYLPDFKERLELARLFLNLKQYGFSIKNNLPQKIEPTTERIKQNLKILGIKI